MLEIQHLTKVYEDGTVALKDVSFTVEDGEFLILIGLSGSGKSTLLRCINRLIEPTEGRVIWNGVDITAASTAELREIRRHIGMIFQQFNLVKRSSVITNVLSGRLGYYQSWRSLIGWWPKEEKERALRNLQRVGIADKADAFPDQLSGGERQRTAIARALIRAPALLLCDEPTGNLDPATGRQVVDLFLGLSTERDVMLIMATHNLELAALLDRRLTIDRNAGKPNPRSR
jgi:phosphonate transport system ATP-binding protein